MTCHLSFYAQRSCIFLIGAAAALSSPSISATEFQVYDGMLFQGRPDFMQYDMPRMSFEYSSGLFPEGTRINDPERHELYEPGIREEAGEHRAGEMVIFDIEEQSWSPKFATSDADLTQRLNKYIAVAKIVHDEVPGLKMGFYAIMPPRNYPAAKAQDEQKLAEWREYCRKLAPLADVVDGIFPSLYTFDDDQQAWVRYAESMIEEAKRYGKPVIPVIWPEYHPTAPARLDKIFIAGDFWRLQLETIKKAGADGVVIWSQPEPWKEDAAWWHETKQFMANGGGARPEGELPGTLQFSSANYSVNEGGASATITVTRTGRSDRTVSVNYSTAGGTATEGADYNFTEGALTFVGGSAASKTFTVRIVDDTDVENAETINLSLSNPDGGATLGTRKTSVLNIDDDDDVTSAQICAGLQATIVGTEKRDTLNGTEGPDVIVGLGGNDVIRGNGGADIICGGDGNDQLYGGRLNDLLIGGPGNDLLAGGANSDYCDGGTHTRRDSASSACETLKNVP